MTRRPMVLGTCAFPGSGQDEFADQLAARLGVTIHRSGDLMRTIASERSLVATRETLQAIRRDLDATHGRDYLPMTLAAAIEATGVPAVVTGIRTLEEERVYRERFDFHLLFVFADEAVRCERVLRRKEAKDPSTRDTFLAQMAAEAQLFDLAELASRADERFDCGMSLDEFRQDFDQLVSSLACVRELKARLAVADGIRVVSENVAYTGGMFEVLSRQVESRQADRIALQQVEVVRRTPGVRVLVTDSDRVLVIREYRIEHGGWDYRLPGGKVYDRLDQFRAAVAVGQRVAADAREAAARELAEEGGITAEDLRLLAVSKAGASVEWDLHYFHCPRWRAGSNLRPEVGELVCPEWVSHERLLDLCMRGEVREDRTAAVLFRFLFGVRLVSTPS